MSQRFAKRSPRFPSLPWKDNEGAISGNAGVSPNILQAVFNDALRASPVHDSTFTSAAIILVTQICLAAFMLVGSYSNCEGLCALCRPASPTLLDNLSKGCQLHTLHESRDDDSCCKESHD